MENQGMPEYEAICATVTGEKWAVERVVECYKDEIDRLSTVAIRQPDGSTEQEINEDTRQSIIRKLIETLPQFPPEEMEKGNVRQAEKEQGAKASIQPPRPASLWVLFSRMLHSRTSFLGVKI